MKDLREKYTLLQDDEVSDLEPELLSRSLNRTTTLSVRGILITLFATICVLSLALNAFLVYHVTQIKNQVGTCGATEFGEL